MPPPSPRRLALVQAGLTRSDIGELASKIGQLYYTLYLRTSTPSWLLEAYTFFEAIHARAYFTSDGASVSVKQLKFYARFIIVCLLLNKKEVRLSGGARGRGNAQQLIQICFMRGGRRAMKNSYRSAAL